MRFSEFGLSEPILRALDDLNYETATPIQEGTIAMLLKDRDVVGQAQTGTGKTAAFMLPILQRIDPEMRDVQALVLCPTRELALQVADHARKLRASTSTTSTWCRSTAVRRSASRSTDSPAAARSSSARPAACSTCSPAAS